MSEDNIAINTVGQLRKAVEEMKDLPDDRMLMCQVVGEESGAWQMCAKITPTFFSVNFSILTISHPGLKNLPMESDDVVWEENSN